MSKPRGPIRRKAGERKRAQEERQRAQRPEPAAPPSQDAASAEPTPKPAPTDGKTAPTRAKAPMGRRVFDPGGDRRGPSPRPASGPGARAVGRGSSGPPKGGGRRDRTPEATAPAPPPTPQASARAKAKLVEQEEARELAKDKGIPLVHALRVVRGEATLNDVLKALMRKERAQRLVERDGLDPGLAGQVASGHLSRERALLIQRIRQHRSHRIDRDVVKVAEIDELSVAIRAFDEHWIAGRVLEARTYEFDFRPDGPEGAVMPVITLQKHNIKCVCPSDRLAQVRDAESVDEEAKARGLAGTADRGERVRPSDERMMELLESKAPIVCLLRDGDRYDGTIRSFGRWDLDLDIGEDTVITVLFHALHPETPWLEDAAPSEGGETPETPAEG